MTKFKFRPLKGRGKVFIVFSLLLFVSALFLIWPKVRLFSVPDFSQAVFDKDAKLLSLSLTKDEKYRLFVPLSEISTAMIQSSLIYEDRYFYYHPGVNPYSILRGAVSSLLRPDRPMGGSTLTMQLVRLTYRINTRTLFGKLKQILLALLVELKFSKTEILEAYINTAPYGSNIEGVGAGSLIYFAKPALKLVMEEAISLAVLPQNPSRRWRGRSEKDLINSTNRLAKSLALIEGGDLIKAKKFQGSPANVPNFAPHFSNRIKELFPDRFDYQSSLDINLQFGAERIINDALSGYKSLGLKNATVLIAELPNMLIRAYVGSANYLDEGISGYVNGLSAKRSPGSLLKPFVYALALDRGEILPESMLQDVPIRLASYRPENFERNYLGPIPATQALIRSRNIPALEVFRRLSKGSFYEFLIKARVKELKAEDHYGIALVLGGLGLTSEELAGLYGTLDQGVYKGLHFFSKDSPSGEQTLLSKEASFLIQEMLSKNPNPLNQSALSGIPWKTGTSYGSKDAWSAGIVGKYVVVLWFGNFDATPNANLVGRDVAGPIFFTIAEYLNRFSAGESWRSPEKLNLKKLEVCAVAGALPNPNCKHLKESWFIRGVSPIEKCALHQRVVLDPRDGLRVCPGQSVPDAEERVYEVWDSGMQELFKISGLKRNLPPPFKPSCGLKDSSHQKLRIINPEEHLEYFLESHRPLEIEFLASVSGEANAVSWFVDDKLIGQTKATQSLMWQAKAGKFNIRAVDNLGNSDVKVIKVSTLTE